MSNPSTPFPWKGDARRAGGWPKGNESEANLRRYAPPPSRGGRSGMSNHIPAFQWKERKIIFPVVEKEQNRSCHPIV